MSTSDWSQGIPIKKYSKFTMIHQIYKYGSIHDFTLSVHIIQFYLNWPEWLYHSDAHCIFIIYIIWPEAHDFIYYPVTILIV